MSEPLAALKRAAVAKRRAEDRYRAALAAAFDAGHGYAELARVLGLARQSVREALTRPPRR